MKRRPEGCPGATPARRADGVRPRLVAARFLERPNRFVVRARLGDGRRVDAHLGDPGRLVELLVPGASLRLRPVPRAATRRTRYTVVLVRASTPPRAWVSVETLAANRLAGRLLCSGAVAGIGKPVALRREVAAGSSRFDFRVETGRGAPVLIEVKSATLVEDGIALFPDAPSARATRHVRELTAHVRAGGRAAVLFIVQRGDARAVAPHALLDLEFAAALRSARRAGVRLRAAGFRLAADGRARHLGPLPVLDAGGRTPRRGTHRSPATR